MDYFYDYDPGTLTDLLTNSSSGDSCFKYDECVFKYQPCEDEQVHADIRYTAESASWVLIASILVFFMKAGFMLLEVAFARDPKEKRYVVVLKHQDAFASAFGFFLIGFDAISRYSTPQQIALQFFGITDPVLWFFKFTFASNAATIVGGCLVTNRYKLRMPAAFISAFVISGIIHPIVARIIWSDSCDSLSPYRFCTYEGLNRTHPCSYNCTEESLGNRMYVLDFAGGGAVHLIGGMAGLMVCLFAKFQDWRDNRGRESNESTPLHQTAQGAEEGEQVAEPKGFWPWMYPVHGGDEAISEAALGVFILWFCWFAFNCGSTESIEIGRQLEPGHGEKLEYPFYGIPSIIAVNMIMAGATGGITAIAIAVWAQLRYRTESVNANEIANGVLSALVSITAGCAFVDYWGACLIGSIGVLLYHVGCFIEYKLGIKDTARVVPVHGVCGLWSLIATGLFLVGATADCNLHAAFEGLCYCRLRLPELSYFERLLAQFLAAIIMIGIGGLGAFVTYFILYITPIAPLTFILDKVFFLTPKSINGRKPPPLKFVGGWLLTSPEEELSQQMKDMPSSMDEGSDAESIVGGNIQATRKRGSRDLLRKNQSYGTVDSTPLTPTVAPTYTNTSRSSAPSSVQYKGRNNGASSGYHDDSDPDV